MWKALKKIALSSGETASLLEQLKMYLWEYRVTNQGAKSYFFLGGNLMCVGSRH